MTADPGALQDEDELINVHDEEDCRANGSLPDAVTDSEGKAESTVPANNTNLVLVNEDEDPKKKWIHISSQKRREKFFPVTFIKCRFHIHGCSKHWNLLSI